MIKKRLLQSLSIGMALCMTFPLTAMAATAQSGTSWQQTKTGQGSTSQTQTQQNQNQNQSNQTNGSGSQSGTAAQYMINQGVMKGDGSSNYNLSGSITRADLMIMLARALNLSSGSSSSSNGNRFNDVSSGDYYYDAVCTAGNLGIAMGDGSNFMPKSYVTIQQAILFLERAAEYAGIDLSVDLETLYDTEDLSAYATREDICELLYYALTGNTDGFDGQYGNSRGWDSDTSSATAISYGTDADETVTFDGSDFAEVCEDATDEDFSYVKFTTLPSSSAGVLYYDYDEDDTTHTKVTTSKSYDEDALSEITFVPKSSYSGTVTVSYTGYSDDSTSYTGTVKLVVASDDITADAISYTTDEDETVTFDGSDFATVCEDATDEDFSYVKFTVLPSSSAGVLYYDYDEDDTTHTKVTTSKSYDEDALSEITFVPKSSYTGTVTVSYTGYSDDSTDYTGTVKITVESDDITAERITYTTDEDETVTFDGSDFAEVCEDATDEDFSCVKFTTLPSSSAGVLYYDYDEDDTTHTKVTTSKSYDEDALSEITYVPKSGYTGTVNLPYTGYTEDGTAYTGTLRITVS